MVVDYAVPQPQDIRPDYIHTGEEVDFTVDLSNVQPTNRGNVVYISKLEVIHVVEGYDPDSRA